MGTQTHTHSHTLPLLPHTPTLHSENTMSKISPTMVRTVAFLTFAMSSAFAVSCEIAELGHPITCNANKTTKCVAGDGSEFYLCEDHQTDDKGDPMTYYTYEDTSEKRRRLAGEPLENSGRRRLGWKPSDDIPRRQF